MSRVVASRRLAVAVILAAAGAIPLPARAAPGAVVVSKDTSYVLGSASYGAPLVVPRGTSLHYVVVDATTGHTLTSSSYGPDGATPLFDSWHESGGSRVREVRFGEAVEIDLSGLAPGPYKFHCENHSSMRGTLTIA